MEHENLQQQRGKKRAASGTASGQPATRSYGSQPSLPTSGNQNPFQVAPQEGGGIWMPQMHRRTGGNAPSPFQSGQQQQQPGYPDLMSVVGAQYQPLGGNTGV